MRRILLLSLVLCIAAGFVAYAGGDVEAGAAPVTLTWWSGGSTAQQDIIKAKAKRFEELNTGAKVEVTFINGWTNIWRKIITAIAAGEPPNGTRVKDYMVTDLARRDALLNCAEYYKRDREAMQADEYFNSLLKPYWVEGGLYGLPWHRTGRNS